MCNRDIISDGSESANGNLYLTLRLVSQMGTFRSPNTMIKALGISLSCESWKFTSSHLLDAGSQAAPWTVGVFITMPT